MWGFGSDVVTDDLKCHAGRRREPSRPSTWYKSLQDQGLTQTNVARSDCPHPVVASGPGRALRRTPRSPRPSSRRTAPRRTSSTTSGLSRVRRPGARTPSTGRGAAAVFATAGEGELTSRDFILYAATNVEAATALYENSAVAPAAKSVADKIPALAATSSGRVPHGGLRARSWRRVGRVAVTAQIDAAIGAGVGDDPRRSGRGPGRAQRAEEGSPGAARLQRLSPRTKKAASRKGTRPSSSCGLRDQSQRSRRTGFSQAAGDEIERPPSTAMDVPVMKEAASEARNATTDATSSGPADASEGVALALTGVFG